MGIEERETLESYADVGIEVGIEVEVEGERIGIWKTWSGRNDMLLLYTELKMYHNT